MTIVTDPHHRHAVIVLVQPSQSNLARLIGDVMAAQFYGTYDPANPPADPAPGIPIHGGPSFPIKSANVPPLLAWGIWGSTQVLDQMETLPDGTTRLLVEGSLAQLQRLADEGIVKIFIGGMDGSVYPTWKQETGWIDT